MPQGRQGHGQLSTDNHMYALNKTQVSALGPLGPLVIQCIGRIPVLSILFIVYIQKENSVDPDQLASEKPANLDLHCFQN